MQIGRGSWRHGLFAAAQESANGRLTLGHQLILTMVPLGRSRSSGCGVVEAASGEAAVEVLQLRDGIDVVFTDIQLGGDRPSPRLRSDRHWRPPQQDAGARVGVRMASAHAAAKTSSVRSFSARTRWKVQHNLSGAFVAVNAETRGARQRSPRSRSFSRSKLVRHFFEEQLPGLCVVRRLGAAPSMLTGPPFALARRSLAGGDGRSSRRCEAPTEGRVNTGNASEPFLPLPLRSITTNGAMKPITLKCSCNSAVS